MRGFGISPRALSSTVENLRALGFDIDENNRTLRALRIGITTGYSLYMLYGAVAALRRAEAVAETAWATGETIAMAAAQQWDKIAQAAAAAALVYTAFKVGEKFGSGDWNFPAFNVNSPVERRAAARKLEGVNG